jgi:spore coat protein U-like protein
MITKLHHWLAFTVLLLSGACSHAAITCNISSNGFSTAYFPANATANVTQTSFTVSCTRALASDPTTVSYSVSADNGLQPNGINNRALLSGTSVIKYDIFSDGSCVNKIKGNTTISGAITFASTGTLSTTTSYWGCVAAAQAGLAAGTYTDAITLTVTYGATPQSTATGMAPVNIATPATCSIVTSPGTVAFGNYVAFGGPLAASAGFSANCTNYLPYTLALGPTATGSIAGVTYTLLLQDAATLATGTSLNVTGNGLTQTYSVNGTMAAGQSGVCAVGTCSGSAGHTLTLSY